MWFLLIQIFFFMLVAAALGAALAWWWLRRRFIDVTETHAELTHQVAAAIADGRALTRNDIDASIKDALSAYAPPQPDLDPIHLRLAQLEELIIATDPKLTVFNGRLANLEQSLADLPGGLNETLLTLSVAQSDNYDRQQEDADARLESVLSRFVKVDEQFGKAEAQIRNFDSVLQKIDARFANVDNQFRRVDEQFRQSSDLIRNIKMPDVESVGSRISALAQTVSNNRPPDIAPLHNRLNRLEELVTNFKVPDVDLGPVHSGLARLDLTLSELQPPDVDLGPIIERLSLIETQLDDQSGSILEGLQSDLGTVLDEKLLHVDEKLEYIDRRLDQLDAKDALAGVAGDVGMISAEIAHISGELTSVGEAVSQLDIPAPTDISPVFMRLSEVDISITDRIGQLETRLAATSPLNEALVSTLAGIEADLEIVASRRAPDFQPVYAQLAALDASLSGMHNELRGHVRLETIEKRLVTLHEELNQLQPPVSEVSRQDITALEDRLSAIEYGLASLQQLLRTLQEAQRTEFETLRTRSEMILTEQTTRFVSTPQPPERAPQPVRTAQHAEAIASARRVDDEANLLTHAAFGSGDDLARIVGVGPILTELLHEVGVFYFWQIAEWTDEDVAYVDEKLLHFRGRIDRDDWVGQSRELAAEPGSAKRPGGN